MAPPDRSTMHTEAFKPPRTVNSAIRNALCAAGFTICALVVVAYWNIGSLFHSADDDDWADLAT